MAMMDKGLKKCLMKKKNARKNSNNKKNKKKSASKVRKEVKFELIIGSYEGFLAGFRLIKTTTRTTINGEGGVSKPKITVTYKFRPSFSRDAHCAAVRCLSTIPMPYVDGLKLPPTATDMIKDSSEHDHKQLDDYSVLGSGSGDENIRLFDLFKRQEIGLLSGIQQGTINCLQFYNEIVPRAPKKAKAEETADSKIEIGETDSKRPPRIVTYLFTGSDDGTICLYQRNGGVWNLLKTLKGHKGPVTHMSIHSSGKLLLTISKDKTLRSWNLVAGRCAYVTNLMQPAHLIKWCPTSSASTMTHGSLLFALAINDRIDVYSVQTGGVIQTIKSPEGWRINSFEFIPSTNMMVFAGDHSDVVFTEIHPPKTAEEKRLRELEDSSYKRWKILDGRIKGVHMNFDRFLDKEGKLHQYHLVMNCSDNCVRVWRLVVPSLVNDSLSLEDRILEFESISSVDVSCRATAFTVWPHLLPPAPTQSESDSGAASLSVSLAPEWKEANPTFKKAKAPRKQPNSDSPSYGSRKKQRFAQNRFKRKQRN